MMTDVIAKIRLYKKNCERSVATARMIAAPRRYIEETIPHIELLMCDELPALIDESQVLVVGLQTEAIVAELHQRCRADHVILDLVALPARHQLKGTYRGVCW